ncbi:MAG TPA: PDZ domain-containing protein [Pirellulales bacterium]|nr:PDZ domain-containing protein [Pirellulales bacterium]
MLPNPSRRRLLSVVLFLLCSAWRAAGANAESTKPIELQVDASEAPRRLFHARLIIPVKPGPLTLCYPQWIPGEHGPNGPINDLAGLKIEAAEKPLPWKRDDVDLYSFHIVVPKGVDSIQVSLDYLAPGTDDADRFTSVPTTPNMAIIHWYTLLLYPQGKAAHDIPVHAKLTLPPQWKLATALPLETEAAPTTTFQTVPLETLADSPVLCGRYLKEISLGASGGAPHWLEAACDSAEGLRASDEVVDEYRRLVAEAQALFGARHYRSYRFLMALSDKMPHGAVEHHESSDNHLPERFFLDEKYRKQATAWVLAHEYVHSWNGKYRRPEGLATADFQQPMRTGMLWVYEGLTEYLGFVLAARSGLYTPELSQENFAVIADWAQNRSGRDWRPLVDTAVAAPFLYKARGDWSSLRRGVDFYNEGALLWLDADTLIREKTGGRKSLDDFCKAFYGGADGPPEVKPYRFDDVVAALNAVLPYDWKTFLEDRLNTAGSPAPLDGLTRGGWKLTYSDKPGDLIKTRDEAAKSSDLHSSLGFIVNNEGAISDVLPGSPAAKAGVGPGMKLIAVNNRRFTTERLQDAVAATKSDESKLSLLLEDDDFFHSATLEYDAGLRYPHLERVANSPDRLSDIFQPRAKTAK